MKSLDDGRTLSLSKAEEVVRPCEFHPAPCMLFCVVNVSPLRTGVQPPELNPQEILSSVNVVNLDTGEIAKLHEIPLVQRNVREKA